MIVNVAVSPPDHEISYFKIQLLIYTRKTVIKLEKCLKSKKICCMNICRNLPRIEEATNRRARRTPNSMVI